MGYGVKLHDSASPAPNLDISIFHAIIVAASVHQECHQDTIIDFAVAHRDQLSSKPTAFISVSLSAVLESEKREAQKYVDRFVATTCWQPRKTLLLGGALRFTEYDYFQQQVVKYVVMKRGGLANTERDYEFTDWKALASFVDEFLEAAEL
jgi:menaquinone-dependent protoporphyrinogen oxidase